MKMLLTTLLLLHPLVVLGQQGTVLYEETVKLDIELPPEMKHMAEQFPSQNTSLRHLFFDGAVSLMKNAPQEKQDVQLESESGGMRFRMMTNRPDDEIYTHFDAERRVEKRDFLGRTFLIEDGLPELAWRLTDERSEFLGYLCQKAVTTRDSVAVEAWFTPEIPVPAGPGPYGGLPGLILVLTEDEGRRTFVAREVSLEPLADGTIQVPSKGKEVTREEFEAVVEEKMKEMGAERGRRGAFQIRMRQ